MIELWFLELKDGEGRTEESLTFNLESTSPYQPTRGAQTHEVALREGRITIGLSHERKQGKGKNHSETKNLSQTTGDLSYELE